MPTTEDRITIVPANEASWEDLEQVLGPVKCHSDRCYCQRHKILSAEWRRIEDDERAFLLRAQTNCGSPEADTTSGLVAYLDDEPVGWAAIEPRAVFANLLRSRILWAGRDEDKQDEGVWAVTCFIVRKGYRRRGIMHALTQAAADFARQRGARALEGYPMSTVPGKEITWGELHVGSRNAFAAAGFREVTHPTLRRFVMRVDFE